MSPPAPAGPAHRWYVWRVSAAMGIQAAVITQVGGMAVSTVVVTAASRGLAVAWGADALGAVAAVLLMKVATLPLLASAGIVRVVALAGALRRPA
jgi:hypothetical protein